MIGRKDDSRKSRVDLIPTGPLRLIGDVLAYGAEKYAEDNWQHVKHPQDRYYAAALRHLFAWREGELVDAESGLPHLAHAGCCVLFLLWFEMQPEPRNVDADLDVIAGHLQARERAEARVRELESEIARLKGARVALPDFARGERP